MSTMIVLQQDLVEAHLVVEGAQSGFEPLHRVVASCMIETLVVDTGDFEYNTQVTALHQKAVFVPEAVQVELGGE